MHKTILTTNYTRTYNMMSILVVKIEINALKCVCLYFFYTSMTCRPGFSRVTSRSGLVIFFYFFYFLSNFLPLSDTRILLILQTSRSLKVSFIFKLSYYNYARMYIYIVSNPRVLNASEMGKCL